MMAEEYERLYSGSEELPVVQAMRATIKAWLPHVTDMDYLATEDPDDPRFTVADVVTDFEAVCRRLADKSDEQIGPLLGLRGPMVSADEPLDTPRVVFVAFDNDVDDTAQQYQFSDWVLNGDTDGPLWRAAKAYHRSTPWDFSPGVSDTWFGYCMPVVGTGGSDDGNWYFTALLAGFLIVARDEEQFYPAHIWTAEIARRKGVATRLIQEARAVFGDRLVYESTGFTDEGAALFRSLRDTDKEGSRS